MFLLFWPTGWWFEHMSTNRKIMKVNLDLHLQEDGKLCMDEYLKGFWVTWEYQPCKFWSYLDTQSFHLIYWFYIRLITYHENILDPLSFCCTPNPDLRGHQRVPGNFAVTVHRNTGTVEEWPILVDKNSVVTVSVSRICTVHIVNCCSCGRKRTYLTNFICAMAKTYQIPWSSHQNNW